MAAPMRWNEKNSQNAQFNQRKFSNITHGQQQPIQRFNMNAPPPGMHPQTFNRPRNPGYGFNSAMPRPTTHHLHNVNSRTCSNNDSERQNDMHHFQFNPERFHQPPPSMHTQGNQTVPPQMPVNFQPPFHQQINQDTFNKNTTLFEQGVQPTDHERRQDELWVKSFFKDKDLKTHEQSNEPNCLKISEAQDKTRQMIVLLARLQKNKHILETLKEEDKSIWDQKLKEVQTLKGKLEVLQNEVMNKDTMKQLQKSIESRKKKRERIKQRRHIKYEKKTQELVDRERKHADIDKHMQLIIHKQSIEKQEKDMQKEADKILSQVRKKQAEASKYLQIVNSLQKLRKLRTDRLKQQGVLGMYGARGNTSAGKLMFEAKMSNTSQLLSNQLDIYKSEEAALKVHLETEHEETREKEREKNRLAMIEQQKQNRKKEEQMLFGAQRRPVPGDPLYPFRQYYDSASNDLHSLISIRRDWDQYLSLPGSGSPVPDHWVIPTHPSSEVWGSVIK